MLKIKSATDKATAAENDEARADLNNLSTTAAWILTGVNGEIKEARPDGDNNTVAKCIAKANKYNKLLRGTDV